MILKNRVTLRDKANFLFARWQKTPVTAERLSQLFESAVHSNKGIGVFESWHGTYAYPRFMIDLMPAFARQNVTRLYVEAIPAKKQPILDRWQDSGDEGGITHYLNSIHKAYSRGMWKHYWMMMQAARDNGIRVVGIDNTDMQNRDNMKRLYDAVFLAPFKNMSFETVIRADQERCSADEKFVVYAGESHGTDFGGNLRGIHDRLGIPRFILTEGDYAIARHPFDSIGSFSVSIPPARDQDPRYKTQSVRSEPVNWTI